MSTTPGRHVDLNDSEAQARIIADLTTRVAALERAVPRWIDASDGVTLENVTPGTSPTIISQYRRRPVRGASLDLVDWWFAFTFGTGGSVSGPIGIPLPVDAASTIEMLHLGGGIRDNGGPVYYPITGLPYTTTHARAAVHPNSPATLNSLNSGTPITWTTGDRIYLSGTYRAAA